MWLLLISTSLLSAALPIKGTFLPVEKHRLPIELNETSAAEDHLERNGRGFLGSLGYRNERPDRNRILILLSREEQLQNVNPPQSDHGLNTISIPVNGWLVPSPSNPDVFNLVLDSSLESRISVERKPEPQLLWRFASDQSPTSQYAEKAQTSTFRIINPAIATAQYEIVPAPAAPSNYILTPTAQNKRPTTPQVPPVPVTSPAQPSPPYQPPAPTYSPPALSPSHQPSSQPSSYSPSPPSLSPTVQSFSPQPQKPSSTFGANNPYLQQAFAQHQRPPSQPAQMAQPPYVPPVPSSPTQPVPVPMQPSYVASYPISSPPPPPPPQNLSEPLQSAAPPPADQVLSASNHSTMPAPSLDGNSTAMSTIEDSTIPGVEVGHVTTPLNIHQSNHQNLSQVPPPPPTTPQQPTTASATYIATVSYGPDRPSLVFNCTKTDQLSQAELSSGSFVEGPYGYACSSSQGAPLPSAGGQIVGMTGATKDFQPAPLQITVPVGITAADLARPEKIRLRPQSNLIGVTL